jgi:hypothetical protein
MSRRPALLAAVAVAAPVLAVLAVSPASSDTTSRATSPPAPAAPSGAANADLMPACPGARLARAGAQTTAVEGAATDTTWDLTGAAWDNVAPDPILYPVRSEAWTRGCIVGAHVEGNVPEGATRDQWYDGKGGKRLGGEVFRITLTSTPGNYVLIRDTLATDYEDAYDPNGTSPADTMYLDHVQARYIRDDCIEDEGDGPPQMPMSVVVRNSLFDGCFNGFAEQPPGSTDSPNGTSPASLTVDDSLMYIQPQPLGPLYCSTALVTAGRCRPTAQPKVWLGSHGIWKWSGAAASHVTVRNTVFRLDMPSYSSCESQQWPAGTYRNVWLVWTGTGPYAAAGGCSNTLPAGVTLTTDARVWDKAKTAWAAGKSPTSPLPAPATATRLSARAAGHRVTGTVATVAGNRLAGASVTLQRRVVGTTRWVSVARARTDSHGVARSTVNPRRTSDFRWLFRGDSSHTGARSNPVRVRPS